MLLRYALVAEPATGHLHSFVWLLKPGNPQHQLASDVRLLPPNLVEQCSLYVDKLEYSWGLPSDVAFAAAKIPRAAHKFQPRPEMVAPMQRRSPSAADAAQLDHDLRQFANSVNAANSNP